MMDIIFLLNLAVLGTCSGKGLIFSLLPDLGLGCSTPLNSPQFAILCRAAVGVDGILGKEFGDFAGLTPNIICDQDCRCTHGAIERGGVCAIPPGRSEAFCICDYKKEPVRESILTPLICPLFNPLTDLCKTVIGDIFLDDFCNEDCRCSHGYPDNSLANPGKQNHCNADTVLENGVSKCFCGNRTNYWE